MDLFNRRDLFTLLGTSLVAGSLSNHSSLLADAPPIRIGIIGLDTSHVAVFTKLLNVENNRDSPFAGARVVAAFPAGNPDFPLSRDRIQVFTKEVASIGVQIVNSIEALLPLVDAVMLESVDGSQHLEQARPVMAAGKPLFIDKPLAASLQDVLAIAELEKQHHAPWFTASSSRFTPGYPELKNNPEIGEILGCDAYSQSRVAPGHPDLFWYGVHGVDLLFSLMGTGCQSVTAVQTPFTEQITAVWENGRVGTYRSIREHTGKTGLGITLFGKRGISHVNNYYDYQPLLGAVIKFFRTRQSPIPTSEIVEVFTCMAAAEESKRRQGTPVTFAETLQLTMSQTK